SHCFFFSSSRRHTRFSRDWSSAVCSSDLPFYPEAIVRMSRLSGPFSHGHELERPKTKPQLKFQLGFWGYKCLTMTYFHRRTSTIIGAKAFHGPVRDGKAWDHLAMVVKRNGLHCRCVGRQCQLGSKHAVNSVCVFTRSNGVVFGLCWYCGLFSGTYSRYNLQGYRIKPHGQLVLVSSMHYCTSTPSLSTSWSRTTLQGGQAPGIPYLQTSFPLRCLQRLSLPYLATLLCHCHDNRDTVGTS